jgi:hypothetical protein
MITGAVNSVGDTFVQLLNEVLLFLPRLVTFAVILLIGYVIARVVKALLIKALRALRFDRFATRAGITRALQLAGTRLDAAAVLGIVVFWWIFLAFIEMAVDSLELTTITVFIRSLLGYIPNIFAALVILVAGLLVANIVADIVRGVSEEAGITTAPLLAGVVRWAIILFAVFTALTQLNVAEYMIFILFAAVVGMLALGLGGVEADRSLIAVQTMSRILQPGRRVQIGQQTGMVLRHDLNTTVLQTGEGQVSIPNATLVRERVTVLSGDGYRQS